MMYNDARSGVLRSDRNTLSIIVAKIYIFCLTFRMVAPLKFLESIIGSAALSFNIIPHFLGFLILLIQKDGKLFLDGDAEGETTLYFLKMVIWFVISSVIMAVIIQKSYGNMGEESAYHGILGMIINWSQYALIVFYNYYVFRILMISEIEQLFKIEILFLTIIGYLQMAIMTYGGPIGVIYDSVDFLDVLNNTDQLPKLSLTGYEGAYTGYISGTLVFPYLYARCLSGNTRKGSVLLILLWLPLIYMSFSSNAYILFSLVTIGFLFCYIRTRGLSRSIVIISGFSMLIMLIILFFGDGILNLLPSDVAENIRYILFEKIQDSDNGSTVLRSVPFYYNWGAFTEYPIIGVGNGLQGYFLEKYLPANFTLVKGVDSYGLLKRWTSGISNGSLFWPSILSGYGLVGVILVVIYAIKSERLMRSKKNELGTMYYMYRLALIGIAYAGFATDFVSKYYVWFAISIPLIPVLQNKNALNNTKQENVSKWKYLR